MTTPAARPTTDDVVAWLGGQGVVGVDPAIIGLALDAALDEQAALCDTSRYTASLHQAALRRTARKLTARGAPLGTMDLGEFGTMILPRYDADIAQAEAAYRVGEFA
jgi:hypothetical protein